MLTLEAIAKELTGTVRDIMTKDVHMAKATSSVVEVADLMAQHNVRHLVVMGADGRVAGVVSQRDVLKHYVCPQAEDISEDGDSTTTDEIQHLITRERPVTVSPNVPLFKAAFVLATKRVGCLPVIGAQEQLVGILTITDLLGHLTGRAAGSLESSFRFFSPSADARTKMPAFIRKMNGDLVIPLVCLESENEDLTYAEVLLGYDQARERIIVKCVEEEGEEGAIQTKRDKENLLIPAHDFVKHFDLAKKARAFLVASHQEGRCLVLTPK